MADPIPVIPADSHHDVEQVDDAIQEPVVLEESPQDCEPATSSDEASLVQLAAQLPLWLQNIDAALPTNPQFILHGAIRDLVPLFDADGKYLGSRDVKTAIGDLLAANGFDALIDYSAPDSLSVRSLCDERFTASEIYKYLHAASSCPKPDKDGLTRIEWFESLDSIVRIVDNVSADGTPDELPRIGMMIDYSSQTHEVNESHPELNKLMVACLKHVHVSRDYLHKGYRDVSIKHPVFWLVDRPNDLPGWMLAGDGIRQIPILNPDYDERTKLARAVLALKETTNSDSEESVRQFASVTEGLSIRGILEIYKLVLIGDIQPERIVEAARQYRLGITENPWQKPGLKESIRNGRRILGKRVFGQDAVIERSLDVLMRSSLNMTYAHSKGGGTGPRGVLFFAGATGTGKTEMAKAIAALVFGTSERIVRFDMSEFSQEHTDARLLGAPPSYVGHGAGGELTNAIRKQPHSVVLFDEIEKANGKILDKFLQILSDGRLTDGSGDTVFFTETIIIFTSNKGAEEADRLLSDAQSITEAGEDGEAIFEEYEETIRAAVKGYFTNELGRPELLGRIGDQNIIIFRPITQPIAIRIAESCMTNIIDNIRSQNGCEVKLSEEAHQQCVKYAISDLSKGGRSIIDALREILVSPITYTLFEHEGIESLTVNEVTYDDMAQAYRLETQA